MFPAVFNVQLLLLHSQKNLDIGNFNEHAFLRAVGWVIVSILSMNNSWGQTEEGGKGLMLLSFNKDLLHLYEHTFTHSRRLHDEEPDEAQLKVSTP